MQAAAEVRGGSRRLEAELGSHGAFSFTSHSTYALPALTDTAAEAGGLGRGGGSRSDLWASGGASEFVSRRASGRASE